MNEALRYSRELFLLTQAVQFRNLTLASQHIGLSQPQLSRLIRRLEDAFQVQLLERSSKRKSSWTPLANQLAHLVLNESDVLQSRLGRLIKQASQKSLSIVCLEGLSGVASAIAIHLKSILKLEKVEVLVEDVVELEGRLLDSRSDFALTIRIPGKRKFPLVMELGQQVMETKGKGENIILSPFEYLRDTHGGTKPLKSTCLISNSLALRKFWIESEIGKGLLPSKIRRDSPKERLVIPVLLIASERTPDFLLKAAQDIPAKVLHSAN